LPTRLTPMAFMLRIRSSLVSDYGLIGTRLLRVNYLGIGYDDWPIC